MVFLGAIWLFLEVFIGLRSPDLRKIKNPRWVAITRGLWLLGPWVCWLDRKYQFSLLEPGIALQLGVLVLGLCGLILRISSVAQLGKAFTYDIGVPESLELRTGGVYRWIRHPSFTGLLILTNMLGPITGSLLGSLLLATTIPNVILRISQEEIGLEERFGATYAKYKSRSYRLLPYLF